MKIECLEIAGFRSALEALRLPYGLEPRSRIHFDGEFYAREDDNEFDATMLSQTHVMMHKKDLELLKALVKRGDEHSKVLRGVIVYTKITAPIYWWWDLETYRAGHERLMSGSTMNKECKGLTGEELQKVKGEIPFGREITKVDYFSYQTLRRIYFQRRNHRLPEFKQFCEWVETLPYAQELITIENVNN
jgi:hypothetical protein